MTFDLGKTAPNVVTEGRLRSLMAEGFNAEVICTSSATRKAAVWYGKWVIRGVSQTAHQNACSFSQEPQPTRTKSRSANSKPPTFDLLPV